MNKATQLIAFVILFVLFVINTTATVVYSRRAEMTAKEARQNIKDLNVTAQNKCIVRVVLSNLPPVDATQFDAILRNYDSCIAEQTGSDK